ncbi:MAG: hypothetical protein SOZ89_06475 [Peptoniphilaceae bacterium]|nr:hypothetical protein [Peptoniphilaceae bacterium]MDD7383579.1 hypothetical protein [Peptoniphilaceae bacterium]MDY3738751.1 hypothetical protein [Peptoniphilaceae bacterium]
MKELFISDVCKDSVNLKNYYDENKGGFPKEREIIDITKSTENLKRFLKYRDELKEFDEIKKLNKIGIPSLIIDEGKEVLFEFENNNCDDDKGMCSIF